MSGIVIALPLITNDNDGVECLTEEQENFMFNAASQLGDFQAMDANGIGGVIHFEFAEGLNKVLAISRGIEQAAIDCGYYEG